MYTTSHHPAPLVSEETQGAIRTILFPTDFSSTAHSAFEYALSLAEQLSAKIILLHVYQEMPTLGDFIPKDFVDALKAEKIDRAMHYIHEYQRDALLQTRKQVEVEPHLKSGKATQEIIQLSKDLDIDLIIMGTQGAASKSEKILGSITSKVIEEAKCPVLAIPAETSYQPIEQIMYAMSLEDHDFKVIDKLVELATLLDAKLVCTHIRTGSSHWTQIALSKFKNLYQLEEDGKISFSIAHHTDVTRGLQQFMTASKVDIMAMLTHKRDPNTSILDQSLTKEMVMYTDIPLLALHI